MKTKKQKNIVVGKTPTEPRLIKLEFPASKGPDRTHWITVFGRRRNGRLEWVRLKTGITVTLKDRNTVIS